MVERPGLTYLLKNSIYIVGITITLTLGAETLHHVGIWMYVGATVCISAANLLAMDRSLIAERSHLQQGTPRWDIALSVFVALWGPLLVLVVSALDIRLRWSTLEHLGIQIPALLVFLLSSLLATWAMRVNRFFSATVRIQSDRGHTVVDTGPYRFVRHPGYTGAVIGILATPFLLGSFVALVPAAAVAGGYIIRTRKEDTLLHWQLPGYDEYAQRVRCRLLPGIW